jgi:hypothetical protein
MASTRRPQHGHLTSPPPTQRVQQRKISALEDTINRLESAGGSPKKRYEYAIINKGTKLTFNPILPAGRILP